jgi:hypothetical protein
VVARDWRDSVPLRQFLVRHGQLTELLERFGKTVTPEELRTVGRYQLRHNRLGPEDHLQTAFEAFRRAKFSKGVSAVLHMAIREANVKVAEQAARCFDRRLGEREIFQIARAMIQRDPETEKTLDFIVKNGLEKRLGRRLIHAISEKAHVRSLAFLDRTAKALKQELTRQDLERLFSKPDPNGLDYAERLQIAQRLAIASPRWRQKVPKLIREARELSLGWGYAKAAESYGQRCGKPLTAEELVVYIDRLRDDDRYRDEVAFAIELAVKRICERFKLWPARSSAAA